MRARWRAAVRLSVHFGVRPRVVAGTVDPQAVPLIMCLWNRPHRIAETLQQLSMQASPRPIRLVLWNNKPENDAHYLAAIREGGARGAVSSIEFHSSRVNLGGIARFVVARSITDPRDSRPFVMLDDDLDVTDAFVSDLLAAYAPRTYGGFWAFQILDGYWQRRAAEDGEPADYVGTGGSICDSALVHEAGFFEKLPNRYGFIEDLWASAFANARGWRVIKIDTPVEMTSEDSNQYLALIDLKTRFWEFLRSDAPTN